MTDIYGGNSANTFTDGIRTSEIDDLDEGNDSVKIDLSTPNTINLIAPSVLVNGAPIGGGGGGGNVYNPLTSDLDIGAFTLIGLPSSQTLNTITTKTLATEAKTVNILSATFPTTTTMQGILRTDQVATDKVSNQLETDYIDLSTGGISITTPLLTLNGKTIVSTPFTSPLEATSFVKSGGTNIQYLMGDGSVLTASANSGNSNYYLFDSATTQNPIPPVGDITYNTGIQAEATIIYISHVTRDNIDIEVFFKQLSTLTDVYIQDQSTSINYIQYNITGTPTIVAEAQVAIPVVLRIGSGTGLTNFPNGHNVLLAFFTNAIEVDTRLSLLESKTQYQTATSLTTSLASSLTINSGIVTTPMSLTAQTNNSTTPNYWSLGFKFTLTQSVVINKIGSAIIQWILPADRILNIYNEGNTTAIHTFTIPASTVYDVYYVLDVNITLPAGTYRLGIDSPANFWLNTTPMTFDSRITAVLPALATTNSTYPTSLGSISSVYAGMFWIQDSSISTITVNGAINLNEISLIDVASLDRPFIGIQYNHSSTGVPTNVAYSSQYTAAGSTILGNAPYGITNNFARQLGCANWTTTGLADGAPCGWLSASGTGAQICRAFPFGLLFIGGISDSAYNANNCQNFFGLWNLATAIPLTQATQLSTRLNFIAFGSNTTDANICIYTAGDTITVKQVDLGPFFPANRTAPTPNTNWFKLALWWDNNSTTMYYKAVNTTHNVTVQGSFVQAGISRMPATTISLFPQCLRIQGSPQSNGQGRLQVQKFGVF